MIAPTDVFTKISIDGKRGWCPKCDTDSSRKQGTVSINGEYAFCHKCSKDWNFREPVQNIVTDKYKLTKTHPVEPTKAVTKSKYDECRAKYLKYSDQIIKELNLPWNDKANAEMFGVGVRRDEKKELQLVFRINEDHDKYHKVSQFGSAKCKV